MDEALPLLVDHCLQHLEHEAHALGALIHALEQVQEALRQHAAEALPDRIAAQQAAMENLEQVRVRRQVMRARLGQHLGVPAQRASLLDWARGLPEPDRRRVLETRARVAQLAQETSRLAAVNVAAVSQGIYVLREVMRCLTGSGEADGRYSALGDPMGLHFRPLVDARL